MEFFLTQLISWRVNSIAYSYILFLSWEWGEVLNYPRHIKVMKVLETCKYVCLQTIRNWLHTVKWYENTGLDLQVESLCLFWGLNCHWDEDVIWVWFCALKLAMFLLGIFILKDVNCSSSTLFNFCEVCYSECHLSSWGPVSDLWGSWLFLSAYLKDPMKMNTSETALKQCWRLMCSFSRPSLATLYYFHLMCYFVMWP